MSRNAVSRPFEDEVPRAPPGKARRLLPKTALWLRIVVTLAISAIVALWLATTSLGAAHDTGSLADPRLRRGGAMEAPKSRGRETGAITQSPWTRNPEIAPAAQPPVPAVPDWSAPHVADQLLLKMSSEAALPVVGARTRAAMADAGMRVLATIPQIELTLVVTQPGADLAASAADLVGTDGVEWAEPNYILWPDFEVNDPYYTTYQSAYLDWLHMRAAWDYTIGQPDVVIAILDTGVDINHEDLAAGIWTNLDEIPNNHLDDDNNGFIDDVHGWDFADNHNLLDDDYGHGTHVAGIAAARVNNATGIAGMAGRATIMPVDVFKAGIGTYEDLIRAIIYATDNGARVINMSLGATSYSHGEEAAVEYAWSRGAVLVAAAGNNGRNVYSYPAAHPHVIAVAATKANDTRADFSNYGDFVDVAAPGDSVYSTRPNNSYLSMSGTSMATPHVSGLAALILSLNPSLTPDQVEASIENNADDLGSAGWDLYFGFGRINALRSLETIAPNPGSMPTPTPGPPLAIWPPGCKDLITDGDFEEGLGDWQASGAASITNTIAYSGVRSIHFPGGPDSRGVLTRTLVLPSFPMAGTLAFAYRISNKDWGYGNWPPFPYDDWLTAEFRSQDGQLIQSLLRTGNSADTVNSGLPWDRFLYVMQPADLTALWMAGRASLVFTAQNDGDNWPTDFWIDAVRFCVEQQDEPPALPDLVAVDLQATGQGCGSGPASVTFTIANRGDAAASNFYVWISAQRTFDEWRVADLPAGESRQFTWNGIVGDTVYTGAVDAAGVVVEADETNNQISRELWIEGTCTPTPTPTSTVTETPTATRPWQGIFMPLILHT